VSADEPSPLYGRNPVREALRGGQRSVDEIAVLAEGRGPGLRELVALARSQGVRISYRTRDQLTAMAGSPHHQGVVARVAEARYATVDTMLDAAALSGQPALILALDRVQDPRNLGAILRTAEATGVHGVIVTKHHAVGLTPAVARSAMGGLEHVPVARETNLVQALERLKQTRVWVMGTAAEGGRRPWDVDLAVPLCLVLGGEGPGLRPLVARTCDVLLTLPMRGRIGSLNVSAAAAALCYEVLRQRGDGDEKGLDFRGPRH
jgi:23S rRNA (guanosine2251-2'-O)-methyltransferase